MASTVSSHASTHSPVQSAELSHSGLVGALVALWALLLAGSIVQDVATGLGLMSGRIWMLDIEVESGLYTWYSTLLLAGASLVTGVVALEKKAEGARLRYHWVALAIIFLALSADEACSVHEALSAKLTTGLGTSGWLHFAWVIPASIACAIGLVLYAPFIMSFPQPLRTWLLMSAAAFLTGAIGMEMAAGHIGGGSEEVLYTAEYRTLATIEEGLEGGAVILFIAVILAYRRAISPMINLRLG